MKTSSWNRLTSCPIARQEHTTHTDTYIGAHTLTQRHTSTHRRTHTHRHTSTHTDTHIGTHTSTHRHRHTHRRTHKHTQAHTHTHTHTQTHAGHSALASSTLVSTQQPVWFFQNWVRSHHLSVKTLLFGSENGGPCSDLPGPREPGPGAHLPVSWAALCLGPFTQPQRPPCRSPDTCLLRARSPRASQSQPSRMVFSQTSTWLLQVTGQCFTIFLIILSKVPPGTPYAPSLSCFYPLHLSPN